MAMILGTYHFRCRFDSPALLPSYKGSTFRGVFGHALKRVVCALRQQECPSCILKNRCLYTRVFETHLAFAAPEGARVSSPPHPFVIEPPETGQQTFEPGEDLECTLLLMGPVNDSLPYFVYAFEQMGRIGIGRRMNGHRGRFVLEEVRAGNNPLYFSHEERLVLPAQQKVDLDQMTGSSTPGQAGTLGVRLLTPLRLKFENQIHAELPFHILVRAALRRASSLFQTWGEGEPALDYKGLTQRAAQVRMKNNRLRWFDWRRYSNRQEKKMFMGGMVGSVQYEGHLAEFLPLLTLSERVHLGKNTSFGLGKIEVEAVKRVASL